MAPLAPTAAGLPPTAGAQAPPAAGAQPTTAPATAAVGANTSNVLAQIAQKVMGDPALTAEWQKISASGDQAAINAFASRILTGNGIAPAGNAATNQAVTGAARTFQQEAVTVNPTHLAGAITGIADIVTKRQKLLAQVSIAIAQDAATNGTPNQAAIVRLNMETTNANLLNDQAKKLYDALEQSIRTWTRP